MDKRTLVALIIMGAVVVIALSQLTLFEDGSWTLGPLSGCLEGWICND